MAAFMKPFDPQTYALMMEPALVGVCHCRDCQKLTGSAFSFLVAVPKTEFEVALATRGGGNAQLPGGVPC
jgi:hypothetical protein